MWDIDKIPDITGEEKEIIRDWLNVDILNRRVYRLFKFKYRDLLIHEYRKKLESAKGDDILKYQGAIEGIKRLFVLVEALNAELEKAKGDEEIYDNDEII